MKITPVDLEPVFLSFFSAAIMQALLSDLRISNANVEIINHWIHKNKLANFRFEYVGLNNNLSIALQCTVHQIKVQKWLVFSEEFVMIQIQESELAERITHGALYGSELLPRKKLLELPQSELKEFTEVILRVGISESVDKWATALKDLGKIAGYVSH